MRPVLPWHQGACVLAAFLGVAALQAWPLPRHLSTHFTGQPSGDTGVYVWNIWAFREALIERGASPFSTSLILGLDDAADLSLHNYTPFADLVGVPLLPVFGVVATFNLIYLLNVALAGFGMLLLAHRLTGRLAESWLAGLLFACSPFLVARSTAHFSLVAAAPIPIFLYWFDRAWESFRLRDSAAAGVCIAWAWACDPYYAVYCVILGGMVVGSQVVAVTAARRSQRSWRRAPVVLDVTAVAIGSLIVLVHFIGGGTLHVASLSLSMRTLYTPVLLLTLIGLLRVAVMLRPHVALRPLPRLAPVARVIAAMILAAGVLLSPVLIAMGKRVVEGRVVSAPVLWRSSAPGVDLLSFLIPNPNHPLAPQSVVEWLDSRPGFFAENVVSLPLVALMVIALAWWRGFRPGSFWTMVTMGFGVLALGPFVQVAGVHTYIPTPWALLRYFPVIGAARMPPRFAIVALMGTAVIFAMALAWITRRYPQRRRVVLATVGLLLAVELSSAPRTLYSAAVPGIYHTIAADPRPVKVLNLPFGIRDGLSSLGDFTALSQYSQTLHGKALLGGYLSRVSGKRKNVYLQVPVTDALMTLSEGRSLTPQQEARARQTAGAFLERARLGYVVIDESRVTPELRRFAIAVLGFTKTAESGAFHLYEPRGPVDGVR